MPGLLVLLLFVGVPLVELYFIVKVAMVIGPLAAVGMCLFTAALGGTLVRVQGLSVLMRVREVMQRGQVPAIEALEGAMLLVSGLTLLLPGFVTDAIGFLLLVPPLRRVLALKVLQRARPAGQVTIIEGEAYRVDPQPDQKLIEGESKRTNDS